MHVLLRFVVVDLNSVLSIKLAAHRAVLVDYNRHSADNDVTTHREINRRVKQEVVSCYMDELQYLDISRYTAHSSEQHQN